MKFFWTFKFFWVSVGYIPNVYPKGIWISFWVCVGYIADTQMIPPWYPTDTPLIPNDTQWYPVIPNWIKSIPNYTHVYPTMFIYTQPYLSIPNYTQIIPPWYPNLGIYFYFGYHLGIYFYFGYQLGIHIYSLPLYIVIAFKI